MYVGGKRSNSEPLQYTYNVKGTILGTVEDHCLSSRDSYKTFTGDSYSNRIPKSTALFFFFGCITNAVKC